MKENLLMKLEVLRQYKIWRNISIILLCIVLILIFKNFSAIEKEEKVLGDSIAEIEINNVIYDDDYRDNKIIEITNNDKIKAVILNIDSPGGAVTPSEILYDLLNKLNQKKPVVVLMNSMATSGAYMIALASDYLIARNTTLTGSIGVLLQSYEIVDLAKNFGVELKTFKSSQLKGMPSIFEKNNEASNKALQSTIDDVYDYFTNLVKTKRGNKISKENFKLAVNGQAFTGRQALKIGLIDEIGDKDSALNYLKSKNIDTNLPIIEIELRKKVKTTFLDKVIGDFFSNIKSINNINKNEKLISIYN